MTKWSFWVLVLGTSSFSVAFKSPWGWEGITTSWADEKSALEAKSWFEAQL